MTQIDANAFACLMIGQTSLIYEAWCEDQTPPCRTMEKQGEEPPDGSLRDHEDRAPTQFLRTTQIYLQESQLAIKTAVVSAGPPRKTLHRC